MLDMLSVQGHIEKKWEEKIEKAFWRGRDSRRERLKLIDIAREHPDLFNVSLTNFFFFRDEEKYYGPKATHLSFFKFFDVSVLKIRLLLIMCTETVVDVGLFMDCYAVWMWAMLPVFWTSLLPSSSGSKYAGWLFSSCV